MFNVKIQSRPESETQQMVSFHDDTTHWDYEVPSQPDPTFAVAEKGDTDLANFFKRPIRIGQYEWSMGADFFMSFNPWILYLEILV